MSKLIIKGSENHESFLIGQVIEKLAEEADRKIVTVVMYEPEPSRPNYVMARPDSKGLAAGFHDMNEGNPKYQLRLDFSQSGVLLAFLEPELSGNLSVPKKETRTQQLLRLVREHPGCSPKTYREIMGLESKRFQKFALTLKNSGKIRAEGVARKTVYFPIEVNPQ